MSVVLYIASREGRLVWRGEGSFALLRPPTAVPEPIWGGGLRLATLRALERRWEALALALPPSAILVAAVVCLLAQAPVGALLLVLLAVGYTTFMMGGGLVSAALRGLRTSVRPPSDDRRASDSLPAKQWSMPLCHQADLDSAGDLMQAVSQRLGVLVDARVHRVTKDVGGVPQSVLVTEVLVCLLSGVTTQAMRARLPELQQIGLPYGVGADVVALRPRDSVRGEQPRAFNTASFFVWYCSAVAFAVACVAYLVASQERWACGDDCAGRPATYTEALEWLWQRLLLNDHPDLRTQAAGSATLGMLVSVMALTIIPVGLVALRQVWQARARSEARFRTEVEDIVGLTRILLVVATKKERDAVLSVARENYGLSPYRELRRPHVVFQLGVVAGTEVMLTRAPGGLNTASGVTLVASSLVRQWRPDFMILTGTCFGLKPEEQQLADVVVVNQARDVASFAVREVEGLIKKEYRGSASDPSVPLLSCFDACSDGWETAEVHVGPMVASSTLYHSDQALAELKRDHPNAVAGDMESHVLAGVAAEHGVGWIAVRGISDWGDNNKNDEHRMMAARNAAAYVFNVLKSGLLDNHGRP